MFGRINTTNPQFLTRISITHCMDTNKILQLLNERVNYLHKTFETVTREHYQKQIRVVFFDHIKFEYPELYQYKGILVRQVGVLYDTKKYVTDEDIKSLFQSVLMD